MRHYIPLQAADGAWHVAYVNHRGETTAVMECNTFAGAYREAATMTLEETKHAIALGAPAAPAYPRRRLVRDMA